MTSHRLRLALVLSLVIGLVSCGESREIRLERYRKTAAETRYRWAGPAAVGLVASEAKIPGAGGPHGDYEIAVAEWKPLAEAGNADAQNFLANMYLSGHGVRRDPQEAERWYRKAIALGHASAMTNLAHMFRYGTTGVRPNANEAVRLYEQAAEAGDAWAAVSAAEMYAETNTHWGESSAYMWYTVAEAIAGDDFRGESARTARAQIAERMTPLQIEEAQGSARKRLGEHRQPGPPK